MKRSLLYLGALAQLLVGALANAEDRPNFDAYRAAAAAPIVRAPGAVPPAFVASTDAQRGVPSFLWAVRSPEASDAVADLSVEAAARRHLARHAPRYGLSSEALATAVVTQIHDLGHGGVIVVLRQRPAGIEVFHGEVKVLMDRSLSLVAIGGNLHAAAVPALSAVPFRIEPRQAVVAALADLYGAAIAPSDIHFLEAPRAERVWFPLPDRLVPAHHVEILAGEDAYAYVIAADDGRILYRESLRHDAALTYRLWADATGDERPQNSPLAPYTPYPASTPDGSYPSYVSSTLVSIAGFDAHQDPWLPPAATVSTGNNTDAYTDNNAMPEGFSSGDVRAALTAPSTFDHTYDPTLDPLASDEQRMASVTSIFYVTNWLHDWWYDSGFDEAAGNAQQDNYGRGGLGGDPLNVSAQDGAPVLRNTSSTIVPADGTPPRMKMYVWDGLGSSSLSVQPLGVSLQNGPALFGPQDFSATGTLVLADDGTAAGTDACLPIVNAVAGRLVLIDRGECTFKQKVVNAQAAGATGVVIADDAPGAPLTMSDGGPATAITIPSLSIAQSDGAKLKAALINGPITVTMSRVAAVDRDGDLDNTLVAHEWGHLLHLRLVACASPMCLAESEGWGDLDALLMMLRPSDDVTGSYPIGQYVAAALPDDPAYFGLRRYPYSTDLGKDPLTFADITSGRPLPVGPPLATATATMEDNADPHAAGEVWASMLFDSYVALLERTTGASPAYSYDEAHRRMSDYVVAGMKLAPTDPTFTEQRDAVLAAAAANDLGDLAVMAQAFARRGAGTCAVSPPRYSTDFSGVVESYSAQPSLVVVGATLDDSVKSCNHDGHLDAGEIGRLTLEVMYTGATPASGVTAVVSTTTAGASFPQGPTAVFRDLQPFTTATATVEVALADTVTEKENLALTVTVESGFTCPSTAPFQTAPLVDYEEMPMASTTDDVEAPDTTWTPSGTDASAVWSRVELTPGNHVWAGIDFPSTSDTALTSLPLAVSAHGSFVMQFDHRYAFQSSGGVSWDGAVIEISSDGGNTWDDISTFGDAGYGGTIGDPTMTMQNALAGRMGYVGQSPSWPALDTVTIDLGDALAGKTVFVRFRIATDQTLGDSGWDLDNISFQGLATKPFPALVDGPPACVQPVTDAGPGSSTTSGAGSSGTPYPPPHDEAELIAGGGCGCILGGDTRATPIAAHAAVIAALLRLARRRSRRPQPGSGGRDPSSGDGPSSRAREGAGRDASSRRVTL